MIRHFALALSLSLRAACHEGGAPATSPAPSTSAAADGMFDVGGGMKLHLHSMGCGSPTVVLDAGFGMSDAEWLHTQRTMAQRTRVWSRPSSSPQWVRCWTPHLPTDASTPHIPRPLASYWPARRQTLHVGGSLIARGGDLFAALNH